MNLSKDVRPFSVQVKNPDSQFHYTSGRVVRIEQIGDNFQYLVDLDEIPLRIVLREEDLESRGKVPLSLLSPLILYLNSSQD